MVGALRPLGNMPGTLDTPVRSQFTQRFGRSKLSGLDDTLRGARLPIILYGLSPVGVRHCAYSALTTLPWIRKDF